MSKLIVSLDCERDKTLELIDLLKDIVEIFKIGPIPYLIFGESICTLLKNCSKKIFIDFKFYDIPSVVEQAVYLIAQKNIFMLTCHIKGGDEMLRSAIRGSKKDTLNSKPLLLGVTVLTSFAEKDCSSNEENLSHTVIKLATLAKEIGLDGVIAAPSDVYRIKEELGDDFIVVSPGIRMKEEAKHDQLRILTPKEASTAGADYIVVGRSITKAKNPRSVTLNILEEIS